MAEWKMLSMNLLNLEKLLTSLFEGSWEILANVEGNLFRKFILDEIG